jgi:hypothetical protein
MLALGYRTAHTAFTEHCFARAEVIADTPVFAHYAALERYYPGSQFIYLSRPVDVWLPSISQLLSRMLPRLQQADGFHPLMQQSYRAVFGDCERGDWLSPAHLSACYQRHQQQVMAHFAVCPERLLTLDIQSETALQALLAFVGREQTEVAMPWLNSGGRINQWSKQAGDLKVASHLSGPGGRTLPRYLSLLQ